MNMEKWLENPNPYRPHVTDYEVPGVLAAPQLELLSVSIYSNDGKPCEVYGTVQVTDADGDTLILYNREENDPEMVDIGDSLTLTVPEGCVISPFGEVKVKVDIKDKARKAVVARGLISWDYSVKDDYDQVLTDYVYGECGHAAVQYITYHHAVLATLEVFLNVTSCPVDDVAIYGNIVAGCGKALYPSVILFKKSKNQSVRVNSGTPISLLRYEVAVPAYSSLVVHANLWNLDTQQQICSDETEEIPAFYRGWRYGNIEGRNCSIKVNVSWYHFFSLPSPETDQLKHRIEEACDEENVDVKKPRLLVDQQPLQPPSVTWERPLNLRNSKTYLCTETQLLEVFSVIVCGSNSEGFDLWGSIKISHWDGEFFIFNRSKQSAERLLPPYQSIAITAPTKCFAGSYFDIEVKLKDAEDRIISAGYKPLNDRFFENPITHFTWYGLPLCTVFRGHFGYAAVHFAIFYPGVQATLKVCVVGESFPTNCRLQVHGSIITEYDCFDYVTLDDKEHYRSKLFVGNPQNPTTLSLSSTCSEFQVPLSKSVVAVPADSSFTVEVGLTVSIPPTSSTTKDDLPQVLETFHGRLNFCVPNGDTTSSNSISDQKIRGNCANVVVYVQWSQCCECMSE